MNADEEITNKVNSTDLRNNNSKAQNTICIENS
jgi:hypothetical protein